MYHPIPRQWLETTNRVDVQFYNGVETKSVSGSGFWVAVSGDSDLSVFITNRHLVDMVYKDKKYRGAGYRLSRLTVSSHSTVPRNRGVVVDLEDNIDIRVHTSYGVDIAILIPYTSDGRVPPFTIPANPLFADQSFFESLPWGAQVSFASFQAWQDNITQKPILRTGIVSSDPRDNYSSDLVDDRKSALLLEAFSFSGSSGSPIFANAFGLPMDDRLLTGGPGFREARVIGIVCGHIQHPDGNVGLSYCHKSTVLLEMLSQPDSLERLRIG
ncbi:MAG: hypothetical protein OYG32_15725 [Rhodospirillaceae bacterium]|nr:hypothetical protein [Rhodospirillaceae bacterium]MDE0256241.1 hypothetical protein [Rhodospirillaceae bacterium]MDE0619862.1 hypothetical protein [Rhodospirillaceae bacterium]